MPIGSILSGETLAVGLRSELMNTYTQSFDGVVANLGQVVDLGMPSTNREEKYAFRRTMPYPELWRMGDPIPEGTTDSLSFSVINYRYARRIGWERDDRMDNNVGDLAGDATNMGRNFASLDTRFFIEVVTQTPSLLPAIPNAPDGVPVFSATDGGGGARFEVTGGNIFAGTLPTASGPEVRDDFFGATAQQADFRNPKGEPFFEADVRQEAYTIYYPDKFRQAFTQSFASVLVPGGAADTAGGVSNVILASGASLRLVSTNRLNGQNSWYIFREDVPRKFMFVQQREGLRSVMATEENSDWSRTTGKEYVQFVTRKGVGINVPFGAIKVNIA